MSSLDSFYIAHFEEKDDFIQVTEKELLLDKVDLLEKDYMIDKQKYPCNPDTMLNSPGPCSRTLHGAIIEPILHMLLLPKNLEIM